MEASYITRIAVAIAILLNGTTLNAADTSAPVKEERMILRAYRVEPGFFSEPNPASKTGKRHIFDARKYLESMHIAFPPGAQAFYDPESQCIVVRQAAKMMEEIDALLLPTCCGPAVQLQCELSTFRLPPALAASLPKKGNLTPETLKQLEKSGQLLDRLLGMVQSGQEAEFAKRTDGNNISRFRVQPLIGPDGSTVDVQVNYHLKIQPAKKSVPLELELKSPVRVEDGHSVVVQNAAVPGNIAVVLRINIVNSCGWTFDEANGGPSPTP